MALPIHMYTRDAQQAALSFLTNQLTVIEPVVYRIQYPDVQYKNLIPVETSGNEWMKSITFFSMDRVGKADWFAANADDIPMADLTREKFEQTIEMAAIGYRYNLEEVGQAMMIPGFQLTPERAEAARRAYEEFVDDTALRGRTDKGWTGVMNAAGITIILVPADGAGGGGSSRKWVDKTFEQFTRDFNSGLSGIYVQSLQIEMADTCLLPVATISMLAERQVPNTQMTWLDWIKLHNVVTSQTGRPLQILGVRGLETAGGSGVGRMVLYRKDPQVLKMHVPMPHRFLPIWQRGPLVFDVPGIFRLGGLEVRRPMAMRYVDGIM